MSLTKHKFINLELPNTDMMVAAPLPATLQACHDELANLSLRKARVEEQIEYGDRNAAPGPDWERRARRVLAMTNIRRQAVQNRMGELKRSEAAKNAVENTKIRESENYGFVMAARKILTKEQCQEIWDEARVMRLHGEI